VPPRKEPDPAELAATLARMREGTDFGQTALRPAYDAREWRERDEAARAGRRPESYRQALEYHGFVYWPPHLLPPDPHGRPRTEGLWRHKGLRFALGETQVARDFPGGPEQLDQWLRDQKKAKRHQLLGRPD